MNPAKVQDFFRVGDSLQVNPANMQDSLTFSDKKRSIADKSCIIAGICKNRVKTGENDVFLHHFGLATSLSVLIDCEIQPK